MFDYLISFLDVYRLGLHPEALNIQQCRRQTCFVSSMLTLTLVFVIISAFFLTSQAFPLIAPSSLKSHLLLFLQLLNIIVPQLRQTLRTIIHAMKTSSQRLIITNLLCHREKRGRPFLVEQLAFLHDLLQL